MLGRDFRDERVQECLQSWPFTLTHDDLYNPRYAVTLKDKAKTKLQISPMEVLSEIFTEIRRQA